MRFDWLERFETRASRTIGIERADSRDRGPSTGNRGGPGGSGRTASGGGGSSAASKELDRITRQRLNNTGPDSVKGLGLGNKEDYRSDASTGSGMGMPPGGTATSATYEPGSVPNVPNASPGQIIGTLGKLMPGGVLNDVPEAVDNMQNGYGMDRPYKGGMIGEAVDSALGTTPGQQDGYQRDRGRGASSFAPNDARGMDSGLPQDSRAIAGESYGAGTQALTGDSTDEQTGAGTDALYSDVTLQDRRKPRPTLGAGTQMVLG